MNKWLPSDQPTSTLFLMKISSRNRQNSLQDSVPEDQWLEHYCLHQYRTTSYLEHHLNSKEQEKLKKNSFLNYWVASFISYNLLSPWRILYNFASYNSCGCLVFLLSWNIRTRHHKSQLDHMYWFLNNFICNRLPKERQKTTANI